MKVLLRYGLSVLLAFGTMLASGQSPFFPETPEEFGPGLAEMLKKTGRESVVATGTGFEIIWGGISIDSKRKIMATSEMIRERKYAIVPYISEYARNIVLAIEQEGVDPATLTDYLNVTNKVLEEYSKASFLDYLRTMSTFFEHHALYYDNRHRVNVYNDSYRIEFGMPEEEVLDTAWVDPSQFLEATLNYDTTAVYEEEDPVNYLKPEVIQREPLGPLIRFTEATLNIATYYDSVFLENTSGFFSLEDHTFNGNGGKFDWTNADLPPDQVYAQLDKYVYDTKSSELQGVDARMTYTGLVQNPVKGIFKYKSVRNDSVIAAKFPSFISYHANHRLEITDEVGVTYRGGFSLDGASLSTNNFMKEKNRLEVLALPGKKVILKAQEFIIGDSTITSPHAEIIIKHKRDSIYHPSVHVTYPFKSKVLRVKPEKGPFNNTPYLTSFFNMNIKTDELIWDLETDSLNLNVRHGKSIVPTVFESINHFEQNDYFLLKGHYDFNPLSLLVRYADDIGWDEFYISDLTADREMNYEIVLGAAEMLMHHGLVDLNKSNGFVRLLPKARALVEAYYGKADYDDMIMESIMEDDPFAPNATVYLEDEKIIVRGVEIVNASDSLNVQIFPDSSTVTILKNRDLLFDGRITAGNFEYTGEDFTFKYDSFLVKMGVIRSVQFFVTDSLGNRSPIDNSMVGLDSAAAAVAGVATGDNSTSGTLYINEPSNKSSKIKYPNYPNFNAGMGAVVYFDRPEIFNGVYDKSIFFVAPPFDIDSLNDSDPASIQFEGVFASSGMLPVFDEKLERQVDNSMGFTHEIPPEGYQLYEGDGKIFGNLTMNKQGLRGHGQIDFLSTTLLSDDFIFYPDSIVADGQDAQIREEEIDGLIFAQADLSNYHLKWLPKTDEMHIYNKGLPFQFYNGNASLDGVAIVTQLGVKGKGSLISKGSIAESDNLSFNHDSYGARNAEFIVQSNNPDKPALAGSDVKVDFNLVDNYADISPEIEGMATVNFPYLQMRTSIPTARWDLNERKVYMTKPENVAIENSYFVTTRQDLDALRFDATEAVYDIERLELTVSGIPFIKVADAYITPENNEVKILENSVIGTLRNTVILLDTTYFYHRLYDGVIDVKSKNEFNGYATYELTNAVGDTFAIKMENFRLEEFQIEEGRRKSETVQHTVANGRVIASDNILMSPGMFFKGDVKLEAHNPMLNLDGFLKLNLTKIPNYNTWIKYNHQANQEIIAIDFDNAVTEGGRVLDAGLYFSQDNDLYSLFVDVPRNPNDEIFFRPNGLLYYDEDSSKFVIEDPLKASGESFAGSRFTYDENTSEVFFEGPVSFFEGTKDAIVKASVIGNGYLDSSNFEMNSFITIDYNAHRSIWDAMAFNLQNVILNLGAPEGLGDPTDLLYKVAGIMGDAATKDYEERTLQEYTSLGGFTAETSTSMVFADVNLKWSEEHRAFYSEGLLGMSNVLGYDVNGAWEGFIESKKNEDGTPVFNVFFKASSDSWYYLSYEDNRLMMYSSIEEFNSAVIKRTNAEKAKIGDMVYVAGSRADAQDYVDTFRYKYYGIDEPYVLDAEADLEEETKEKKKKEVKTDDGF